MYTLEFDSIARVMRISAEGFWTLATVATFSAEALARGAWSRARYGRYAILVDARRLPVQSGDVARALEVLLPKSVAISDAPYAIVVGSALVKLQSERVLTGENCRTFLCMDEAEAWLATEWMQARAA